MTQQTDDTTQQGEPNGGPGQEQGEPNGTDQQTPTWDELFAGEDPAKVREQLAHARSWERKSKEYREKAEKFDALEDAKKTPDQKSSEALERLQRERDESTQKLIRYEVAAETGIPAADVKWLQGNTKEELLASAEEFITRVGAAAAEQRQRRGPAPDPTQGRGGAPAPMDGNDFLRQQFQNRS